MRAKRSNLRSGLLDRYPNLKFIFEEGNVGYALYLFDRLEAGWEFGEMIYGSPVHLRGPKKRPLEYLEHFHWAVESEDSLIAEVVKRWGAERILFSTDYPHGDTPWPESVQGDEGSAGFVLCRRSGQSAGRQCRAVAASVGAVAYPRYLDDEAPILGDGRWLSESSRGERLAPGRGKRAVGTRPSSVVPPLIPLPFVQRTSACLS